MKHELDAAILIENLEIAAEISNNLRCTGVIPHFYEDFKSFWYGTHDSSPSLAIVDVKLMSSGELSLHDHPMIKNNKCNIIFFHNDATAPLLFSTYDLWHLGTINSDQNLKGQLKGVLKRLNHKLELETTNENLKLGANKYERKLKSLATSTNSEKERVFYRDQLINICNQLDRISLEGDFSSLCKKVLAGVEFISGYSIMELAPGEQRLLSTKIECDKHIEIPALWLGKKCENGIELFAQNLATQVAIEVFDEELMVLAIKGAKENPDLLLFIKSEDEGAFNNFDWDFLERHLSGIYGRIELRKQGKKSISSSTYDCWEMMDAIDGEFFKGLDAGGDLSLINVNFDKLIAAIRIRPDIRFFWGKFFEEFKSRMALSFDFNFKFSPVGTTDLGVLIPASDAKAFELIKIFTKSFPYWRYFENTDFTIGKELTPEVRMIPMSAEAYLSFIENREVVYTRNYQNKPAEQSVVTPRPSIERERGMLL
ncbi:MAG: hypothetical protein KAG61_09835 [Bacteriovoracaceae bacterium]|nr:hypothetical protein [Bacteriovoracaceae bacterium]